MSRSDGVEGAEPPDRLWLGIERKWWVLVAAGVGTFMSALDSAVVNTVVPVIMKGFAIDFAMAEWITMIYLLTVCGLLLTFGRLGDMTGHKRMVLLGFAIFTVGSLACALAPSALVLIGMRGVQAIGGAMLFSNAPAILTGAFPRRQRGEALGLWGAMTYLGLAVGPALGGALTDHYGWRAIFLVNLPIGIIAIALSYLTIARERPAAAHEKFDPIGAISFLLGLSALLLALSHGQNWGWGSPTVLVLLVAAVVLLAFFIIVERRVRHPMLDLSLFGSRLFSAAVGSAIMNYICVYAVIFLLPFYLIQYRGLEPGRAGILLSAQALTMMILAPVSGTLSDRFGPRLLSSAGMAIMTVALVLLGTVDAGTGDGGIVARLLLVGVGAALFTSPNSSALMGAAPRERQGIASGVLSGARSVGMVLGIAFSGAVFMAALAAQGTTTIAHDGAFLPSFETTFFAMAIAGAVGTILSLARGKHTLQASK